MRPPGVGKFVWLLDFRGYITTFRDPTCHSATLLVFPCLTTPGVGKFAWLLDFQGYTMANAPPLRVSLHCNSVLANHYPERLGLAVCYHAPVLFSYTYKVRSVRCDEGARMQDVGSGAFGTFTNCAEDVNMHRGVLLRVKYVLPWCP